MKPNKAVIAINGFKGSRTSAELCFDIKTVFSELSPLTEVRAIPVADGGDGFFEALTADGQAKIIAVETVDALGRGITSKVAVRNGVGIIETALATGIALINKKDMDALGASTYGSGLLLKALLDSGISRFFVGVGGSATTDGGIGLLTALGYRFKDEEGKDVKPNGGNLLAVRSVDDSAVTEQVRGIRVTLISDVDNPLFGERGAAYVYAPQKGADGEGVQTLDKGLRNFARITADYIGKDCSAIPGAGAAGGLGFGLIAYLNAEVKRGAETVLELCGFKDALQGADLVITGEGRLDSQSLLFGKLPAVVASEAKARNIACVAFAGSVTVPKEELLRCGVTAAYSLISLNPSVDYCIAHAGELVSRLTEKLLSE